MKVTNWMRRVACVLSAAWLAVLLHEVHEWRRTEQVVTYGVLPLVAIWGLAWVIARVRASNAPSPARSDTHDTRWHFVTVLVVAIGLIGAFLAVDGARLNYDSTGVTRTAFYWAVIGAIAGFAAAAICRSARSLPLLVAAVVAVGGIDWKYGSDVWESHLMTVSYAKSVPLLNRIETGTAVTEQQVRDANVGIYEPLLLAEAGYRRDAEAIAKAYEGVLTNLNMREAMSPRSLSTASGLVAARDALAIWRTSLDNYAAGMDTIGKRDRATMQAALDKAPAQVRNRIGQNVSSGVTVRAQTTNAVIKHERDCVDAFTGIVDLLGANIGKYRIAPGGTNQLQFADYGVLARYNDFVRTAQNAARWEKETLAQQTRESDALVKRRSLAAEK